MSSHVLTMLRHRSTLVWAGLMAATIASWWLGTDHASLGGPRAAPPAAQAIAVVKVALVTSSFMEVDHASRLLQTVVHGWTVAVGAGLVVLYLAL